jgi:hypothetical protein
MLIGWLLLEVEVHNLLQVDLELLGEPVTQQF